MNQVMDLINKRTSLRNYDDKDVSKDVLSTIINAAMRAPTAGNMMLYSIIVVKDQNTRSKLSVTCDDQPFIAKAPVNLIFVADMQRMYDFFVASGVKETCDARGLPFYKPTKANLMLAISDALIAAQNAVIAAESLGLGTCYIGDIMENYETHKELLDLPEYVFPIGMLTLGYSKDEPTEPRPRFPETTIVFDEKYRHLQPSEFESMFKRFTDKIDFEKHPDADNFGELLYFKKFGSEFSREMARSVDLMLENWD